MEKYIVCVDVPCRSISETYVFDTAAAANKAAWSAWDALSDRDKAQQTIWCGRVTEWDIEDDLVLDSMRKPAGGYDLDNKEIWTCCRNFHDYPNAFHSERLRFITEAEREAEELRHSAAAEMPHQYHH